MATLGQLIPRIMRHANRRYGQPYLIAVRPIAQWSLPAGFAYDDNVDALVDGAGTVLPNPESYWLTDTVYIVPARFSVENTSAEWRFVTAGGVIATGYVELWVGQADIETVRAAHAIQINERWYDMDSQQEAPSGYPTGGSGLWTRVRLRGRS